MTALHHYALRDEQEKYFSMMKGILGADRQRNSTQLEKEGRLFLLFVAQILGCCLAYVRKAKLNDNFHDIQDVLNEMRPIRYIEHPGTKPFITPFIGKQVDICKAFGFDIPEGVPLNTWCEKRIRASPVDLVKTSWSSRILSTKNVKLRGGRS